MISGGDLPLEYGANNYSLLMMCEQGLLFLYLCKFECLPKL